MNKQITSVFYASDLLPYKDSARTVHYPLTAGTFAGSHNTKEVRFYVRDIGGTSGISWVVVSKLPNGKIGYEVCSNVQTDSELGEQYLSFDLSAYYTQVKGDLYLALRGYQGQITFEDDDSDGVYNISGDPLIEVTGTIKLSINYSPMVNTGTQVLPTDIDRIIAALSDYLLIENGIVVISDISSETASNYEVNQILLEYHANKATFYVVKYRTGTTIKHFTELSFASIRSGELRVEDFILLTNEARLYYDQLNDCFKITVNSHTLALFVDGTVTIDGLELATEDYVDTNFYTKTQSDNRYDIQSYVELSGTSGTLTDEQLTKVQRPNAIIKLTTGFYQKYSETSSKIEFRNILNPLTIGNGKWAVTKGIIEITKSTGAWAYTTSSITSYTADAVDTNFYTKSSVDTIVSTLKANSFQIVATLPATGQEGIIYLVETSANVYEQYIWESGSYIDLGTTQIDLSGYATTTWVSDNFVDLTSIQTISGNKTFKDRIVFCSPIVFNNSSNTQTYGDLYVKSTDTTRLQYTDIGEQKHDIAYTSDFVFATDTEVDNLF